MREWCQTITTASVDLLSLLVDSINVNLHSQELSWLLILSNDSNDNVLMRYDNIEVN